MKEQLEATGREAALVEDAALIRMMGFPVLEALPSRSVPYEQVDPFILVHEGRLRLSDMKGVDTRHPHRGFDNLWYVLEGSVSTGHSTGPGGAMERARLSAGALLALRTGRGAWHAEAIGADELEEGQADSRVPRRAVLGEPRPKGQADGAERTGAATGADPRATGGGRDGPGVGGRGLSRSFGDARAHPRRRAAERRGGHHTRAAGVPGLRLRAGRRGGVRRQHRRRARPPQLVLLGRGDELRVTDASRGTRYLLMAGQPYGEVPVFNGPYVD